MKYILYGANQTGYRGWNWFEGTCEVKINPFETVRLVNYGDYDLRGSFSWIRKLIMKLMGFKLYDPQGIRGYAIIHDSIIERYFTKIN